MLDYTKGLIVLIDKMNMEPREMERVKGQWFELLDRDSNKFGKKLRINDLGKKDFLFFYIFYNFIYFIIMYIFLLG